LMANQDIAKPGCPRETLVEDILFYRGDVTSIARGSGCSNLCHEEAGSGEQADSDPLTASTTDFGPTSKMWIYRYHSQAVLTHPKMATYQQDITNTDHDHGALCGVLIKIGSGEAQPMPISNDVWGCMSTIIPPPRARKTTQECQSQCDGDDSTTTKVSVSIKHDKLT
jgi:hypothetical protein